MDLELFEVAREQGKPVAGLESLDEQSDVLRAGRMPPWGRLRTL